MPQKKSSFKLPAVEFVPPLFSQLITSTPPVGEISLGISKPAWTSIYINEFVEKRDVNIISSLYSSSNSYHFYPKNQSIAKLTKDLSYITASKEDTEYIISTALNILYTANEKRRQLRDLMLTSNQHVAYHHRLTYWKDKKICQPLTALYQNSSVCVRYLLISFFLVLSPLIYMSFLLYTMVYYSLYVGHMFSCKYRSKYKEELVFIYSKLLSNPAFDTDAIDNDINSQLQALCAHIRKKVDRKVQLWIGVERVKKGWFSEDLMHDFIIVIGDPPLDIALYKGPTFGLDGEVAHDIDYNHTHQANPELNSEFTEICDEFGHTYVTSPNSPLTPIQSMYGFHTMSSHSIAVDIEDPLSMEFGAVSENVGDDSKLV